jgi:hypothetical protein
MSMHVCIVLFISSPTSAFLGCSVHSGCTASMLHRLPHRLLHGDRRVRFTCVSTAHLRTQSIKGVTRGTDRHHSCHVQAHIDHKQQSAAYQHLTTLCTCYIRVRSSHAGQLAATQITHVSQLAATQITHVSQLAATQITHVSQLAAT